MQTISTQGNFSVSSSFGSEIIEGTEVSGKNGQLISFQINQNVNQYSQFYYRLEPGSGSYSDFWLDSARFYQISGRPAEEAETRGFTASSVTLRLNPDSATETNENFDISFYASNLDPSRGISPLIKASFTIIDDDPILVVPGTVVADGVHRFFNTQTGGHFFTISDKEAAEVQATRPDLKPEGTGFGGFANDQGAATEEVYRFFNTKTGGHFFTTSEGERDQVIATNSDYKLEGIGFYDFIADQGVSTNEVYRFFNIKTGGHFFTASEVERDQVIATTSVYHYEGVAFYAPGDGATLVI